MGFTGRLGTEESQLGNIVLGIVDSFGLVPIQCKIYPDSPKSFLAVFERPVTDSALVASRYAVTPTSVLSGTFRKIENNRAYYSTTQFYPGQRGTFTTGPNDNLNFTVSTVQDGVVSFVETFVDDSSITGFETTLPHPVRVEFTDTQHRTVRVHFATNFTAGSYNVTISGVGDFEGRVVESVPRPFTIIASRTIFATSAKFSANKCIDVTFDQPVNPYTTAPSFLLLNETGNAQTLTVVSWSGLGLPANVIRLSTGSVSSSFSFKRLTVNYTAVRDSSNNTNDGLIPIAFENPTSATTFGGLVSISATEAFLLDRWMEHNLSVVRVYFNGALKAADVLNTGKWTITTTCGHTAADSAGSAITASVASDLATLTALVLDMESKVYTHFRRANIHLNVPSKLTTPSGGYSTLADTLLHLNSLSIAYNAHVKSESAHAVADGASLVTLPAATNLSTGIALANAIRASYTTHRSNTRTLSFSTLPLGSKFPVNNHASTTSFIQNSFGPSYFVDLYLDGLLGSQPTQVQCTLGEEVGSGTTDPNTTGKVALSVPHTGFFQDEKFGAEFWNKGPGSVDIQDLKSAGVPLRFRAEEEYTNDMFVYLLCKLYGSYNLHINTVHGAQHVTPDTNAVPDSMFPDIWDPIRIQTDLNTFYSLYLHPHTQSMVFHTDVVGAPAPDTVFDIYRELQTHNSSGRDSRLGRFGSHIRAGKDTGELPVPNMRSLEISQPRSGSTIAANGTESRGFSYPSSARSVIQTPGVMYNLENVTVRTEDTLILNFSEPLKQTPIQPSDFVCASSGNIKVLDAQWVDERTISLRVRGLLNSTGAVFASNLVSKSGESL